MNKTKENILKSAIWLYNEEGTIHIILQKIANKAGISIGNLTYHFKNKEELLVAVFDLVQKEIFDLYKGISLIPTVEEIIEIELNLFNFQNNYRFIFLDFVNIVNYNKDIANKFRENIVFQIKMITTLLNQGVENGTYKKEHQYEFESLAKIIWNIFFNRLTREFVMNESYGLTEFAKDVWLILKPFLTEEGIKRYEKMFYSNVFK